MITKKGREGGFSLLELAIAMLIIGILVAVVILLATGFFSEAREAGWKADLRAMQNAVSDYMIQSNKTPTADGKIPLAGKDALIDFDASFTQGLKTFTFYPDFIEKLPKHHDEGLWRIDSRGAVSVDIDPEEY
jgi:prepilin-type N-terminal cleavage/methylation domain-containing protein